MQNTKILSLGFLAITGAIMIATPSTANTTHDTNGVAIQDPSGTDTDPPGSDVPGENPATTQFDSDTGIISGGVISNPIDLSFGSGSGSGSGQGLGSSSGSGSGLGSSTPGDSGSGLGSSTPGDSGSGNGDLTTADGSDAESGNNALGKGECATVACLSAKDGSQEVTLNDAAKLLEDNIDASLDDLIAAENLNGGESEQASITRRITRKNSCAARCVDSDCSAAERGQDSNRLTAEAREVVEKQLVESQKFIEQVNLIDPDKNLW